MCLGGFACQKLDVYLKVNTVIFSLIMSGFHVVLRLSLPSTVKNKKRILTFYFNNILVYFVYVISSCISHEILVS